MSPGLIIDDFFEIRYPNDYKKSGLLVKTIILETNIAAPSPLFDIEASIKFDSPIAMFEIGLFERST